MSVHLEPPASLDTPLGSVGFTDVGAGPPVLFVHGSPGGWDQGELMTRFLVAAGLRVIAPSRPGYPGTALTDQTATPDAQSQMLAHLVESLGLDSFGIMCWSGGGPSSYRLAAEQPDRVTSLVAIAAVSKPFTFVGGIDDSLLAGRLGPWLMKEMAKHSPKSLIKSTVGEEGDLSKEQLKELVGSIWDDETKRNFVLELSATVAGRKEGLHNDHQQFPELGDLPLSSVAAPTLLVHGTADADVPPEYSDFALTQLPNAELLPIQDGTHIAAWTDPTSEAVQSRIVAALS